MALIEASRLLLAYGIDYAARVQNGYVSPGTAGTRVHPKELENGPVSSENVPASPRAWTRIPYLSFPRNEGVPGSSPSVGFSGFAGFSVMKCRAGLRARGSPEVYAVSGAPSYLVLPGSWGEVVARPACHLQSSGVTVSHFQSVLRWRPGLASGRPAPRALRHHMKCSSSVGVGGPSCTAKRRRSRIRIPITSTWRFGGCIPALVFAVEQDETAARATWGRSCARWTPASRPRRASEATVRTRSHWAGSKSGRYEHSGSGRQKGAAGRLPKATLHLSPEFLTGTE